MTFWNISYSSSFSLDKRWGRGKWVLMEDSFWSVLKLNQIILGCGGRGGGERTNLTWGLFGVEALPAFSKLIFTVLWGFYRLTFTNETSWDWGEVIDLRPHSCYGVETGLLKDPSNSNAHALSVLWLEPGEPNSSGSTTLAMQAWVSDFISISNFSVYK